MKRYRNLNFFSDVNVEGIQSMLYKNWKVLGKMIAAKIKISSFSGKYTKSPTYEGIEVQQI